MKTLYLIRHAKSSWDDFMLTDRQRPLNERGLRDAPTMAAMLAKQGVVPDGLVSSPAVRAHTTAGFFADALGISRDDIELNPMIYESNQATILQIISTWPDHWNTVCIFGHNPTFTDVANLFPGQAIDNIPTSGIVRLDSTASTWHTFSRQNTRIGAFLYPKQ